MTIGIMGIGAGLISIGEGLMGIGAGLISIGEGLIGIGAWLMTIGAELIGIGLIITMVAGEPESITLFDGMTRVSRPTPMRASSDGRGEGLTVGPLL
jgi:hypothetical protein